MTEANEPQNLEALQRELAETKAELERQRQQAQNLRQWQSALFHVQRELGRATSFDAFCKQAVIAGRERFGLERIGLWFVNEARTHICGSYGTDEQGHICDERDSRILLSSSVFNIDFASIQTPTIRLQKSLLSTRVPKEERFGERIVAPLWDGDQVIGFLSLDNLLSKRPFSPEQIDFIAQYANCLGYLCRQFWAEQQRQESEAHYQQMIAAATDGIVFREAAEGSVLSCNASALRILGMSREEMQITAEGPAWWEVIREDGSVVPHDQQPSALCMATGLPQRNVILGLRRQDGSYTWASISAEPLFREGEEKPYAIVTCYTDITELKQAKSRFQEREEMYRRAIAMIGGAVYIYDFTRNEYAYLDEGFEALLGYSIEELTPQKISDISIISDTRPPLDHLTLAEAVTKVRSGEIDVWAADTLIQTAKGELRYFADSSISLRDANGVSYGSLGLMLDVTDRKNLENALRASEERFRQMADNIPEIFFIVDWVENRLIYTNAAFESIFGIPPAPLEENMDSLLDIVHPDDREWAIQTVDKLLEGETLEYEYRIVRPDGSVRWLQCKASPVHHPNGEVYRSVGIVTDITEPKRLQEQLHQSRKMESIGRLAGGIAHDFNNILTAIMGFTEMLEEILPQEGIAPRLFSSLQTSCMRAAGLTSQLLAFARKQVIKPIVFDLHEVLEEATGILRPLMRADIQLTLKTEAHISYLFADPGQIQQVILNLVINAKDAMPRDGNITLSTANRTLSIEDAQEFPDLLAGEYLQIMVRDTGKGIPQRLLSNIFEPFFTTKPEGKGTGLGLATCYGVVKQNQGHISVESEEGKGTCFEILLPIASSLPLTAKPRANRPLPQGTETVLLVEDEEAVREIAAMYLQQAGYQVLETRNGEEGLHAWRQNQASIHLVLTDVVMPQKGGVEMARHMAQTDFPPKTLYMSGFTGHEGLEEFIGAQEIDYLHKPFTRRTLLEKVREVLDRPS